MTIEYDVTLNLCVRAHKSVGYRVASMIWDTSMTNKTSKL